jgi:molybdopterin-guanine dinucleotide biosynthesis protein A
MMTDITGILLAGGKSRRMGEDKRFLQIGERSLFDRSLSVLRSLFRHVLVVIAQDSQPLETEVPVLRDLVPDCGSLGGLYTGLKQATTPFVFVVACDMPFLDPRTIGYFTDRRSEADIVIAKLAGQVHPMHAVYGQRCLPVLEAMTAAHELKIQRILADPSLRIRLITESELGGVDPEGRSFMNVNTLSDLESARAFWNQRSDAAL